MNNIKLIFRNLLRQICLIIISFVLFISSIFFIFFSAIPFFLFRSLVSWIVHKFGEEKLDKILTTRSTTFASFSRIYTNHRFNIFTQVYFGGKPDIEEIRRKAKEINNLRDRKSGKLLYPEMSQNICYKFGYPFWARLKEGVDLTKQIHFYKNDETLESNDEIIFNSVTNEHMNKPYSRDGPLWEFIIYPNYKINPEKPLISGEEGKEYFVIVFKFSHALSDALSFVNYYSNFSKDLNNFPLEKNAQVRKETERTKSFKLVLSCFKYYYELAEFFLYCFSQLNLDFLFKKRNAQSNLIFDVTKQFPFERIRQVKTKHPSINGITVVFTAIAEALRQNVKNLPPNLMVINPLPLPGYDGSLTNHATSAIFYLPLQEMDGKTRLYKIQRRMEKMRKSSFPLVTRYSLQVMGLLPRCMGLFMFKISLWAGSFMNLEFITNLAIPKDINNMIGYPMLGMGALCGAGQGSNILHIVPLSINGMINVSVTGAVQVLETKENLSRLTQSIYEEIDKITGDWGMLK